MLQTGPAQANTEEGEGDPNPCKEDEELFEVRPDAEGMEKAISKFMDGMDQQDHTGFDEVHKPLQLLPVPEDKNGTSMTQAAALEGGFLRDLDEDEKKRFTPSELVLYKHAVEYRYIPVHTHMKVVHTSTYQYIPVHTRIY